MKKASKTVIQQGVAPLRIKLGSDGYEINGKTTRLRASNRTPVVAFVLRLPAALHRQVTRLAKRDSRSLNSEIQVALQYYLDHRKKERKHGSH